MNASEGVAVIQGERKWHASPVTCYRGPLDQVRKFIPFYDRKTFGPALLPADEFDQPGIFSSPLPPGFNRFYDVIVRRPMASDEVEVPVGIVSKQYSLIQHQDLVDAALNAVKKAKIDPVEIKTELDLTEYGERMRLGLIFPKQYGMMLPNNDEMGLRLECFNSVDGSMKFMSVIGWLRFVCANGMVLGVADTYYRSRHNRFMELSDICSVQVKTDSPLSRFLKIPVLFLELRRGLISQVRMEPVAVVKHFDVFGDIPASLVTG